MTPLSKHYMDLPTIVAVVTPQGMGAIGVIRLSGVEALSIASQVFHGKNLQEVATHTAHYGYIKDKDSVIDEVIATVFKAPHSYTKEDTVEFSCHGSEYILQQSMLLFVSKGAMEAQRGEFTKRAFLNGRFDLTQAEAVADLIVSEHETMHKIAIQQMRGNFSDQLESLRTQLVHFASMVELGLDFSEEDVEFANEEEFLKLLKKADQLITPLIESFHYGNVIKNGVSTVIAGKPNVGKSTLINALLQEERAIVSDIPGTTRDIIEDVLVIEGISFRLMDTAGIRSTTNPIESIGVKKAEEQMDKASIVLYLIDLANDNIKSVQRQISSLAEKQLPYLLVGNKLDVAKEDLVSLLKKHHTIFITAKEQELSNLKLEILQKIKLKEVPTTIVTNVRHLRNLEASREAITRIRQGIQTKISGDLLAQDIRNALHHIGEITGAVTTDDLLDNIFSKFCIGK